MDALNSRIGGLSGVVSGIDSQGIIKKLADFQRKPILHLQQQAKALQDRIGVFQDLNTRILSLSGSLNAVTTPDSFLNPAVSSSGPSTLEATLSGTPQLGTYKIQVQSLGAQTQAASGKNMTRLNLSSTLGRAGFATSLNPETVAANGQTHTLSAVSGSSAAVRVQDAEALSADNYTLDVVSLATSTVLRGGATPLDPSRPLSEAFPTLQFGSAFEINGQAITVEADDSLNDVMAAITASSAGVTASYDASTQRLTLENKLTGADAIVMGDDDVGLMQALGVDADQQSLGLDADFDVSVNGGPSVRYRSADNTGLTVDEMPGLEFDLLGGGVSTFTVEESADNFEGGRLEVNGEVVTWRSTDSLQSVLDEVAASTGGGVTASYDGSTDKIAFESTSGGAVSVKDLDGNLLRSMGFASDVSATGGAAGSKASRAMDQTQDVSLALRAPVSPGHFVINDTSIEVKAGDSLERVLNRISNSSAGVTARYDAATDHIVLKNKALGEQAITLGTDDSGFFAAAGLDQAAHTAGSKVRYTLDGEAREATSTTVTDAIGGVTLKLTGTTAAGGADTEVKVELDSDATSQNIDEFVEAVNDIFGFVAENSQGPQVDGNTLVRNGGPLLGNLDVVRLVQQLRKSLTGTVAGQSTDANALDDIGISLVRGGGSPPRSQLQVDSAKLAAALKDRPEDVKAIFTQAADGIGSVVDGLTQLATAGGGVYGSVDLMQRQLDRILVRAGALEERVLRDSQRLSKDFLAMEQSLARMNGQGTALTSLLARSTRR